MSIRIQRHALQLAAADRAHVIRRLRFALARFGERVERVTVHLLDVNGPRGGVDKVCRLVAKLHPRGIVIVEDADADILVAVDRAAGRLRRTVGRWLDRERWLPPRCRREGALT